MSGGVRNLIGPRDPCRCDGSGYYVVCIDDICRGVGECIHGDGMAQCPCDGEAYDDDEYPEHRDHTEPGR